MSHGYLQKLPKSEPHTHHHKGSISGRELRCADPDPVLRDVIETAWRALLRSGGLEGHLLIPLQSLVLTCPNSLGGSNGGGENSLWGLAPESLTLKGVGACWKSIAGPSLADWSCLWGPEPWCMGGNTLQGIVRHTQGETSFVASPAAAWEQEAEQVPPGARQEFHRLFDAAALGRIKASGETGSGLL